MSSQNGRYTFGRRRRRIYPRLFDWDEARRRAKKGETHTSIARSLGVDRRSIDRVVKLPARYVAEATQEQIESLIRDRKKVPCPRCTRPMSEKASLCRDCTNELRLAPMTVRRVPGTPRGSRVELRSVGMHRIVEVDGEYGVVSKNPHGGRTRHGYRVVDFWDGGPMLVPERIRVAVLPTTEVLVGGVSDGGEEIE